MYSYYFRIILQKFPHYRRNGVLTVVPKHFGSEGESMSSLALLDKDGDGDIDSSEWAAGYAQLGASAPGVPNPAVWYGTLPDGPAFSIEQTSMVKMYTAPSQLTEHKEFRDERAGVMVGYAGHVPRARDKVGGSPLGHLPGTPVSPNGAVGIDMEAMMSGKFKRNLPEGREKTFAQIDEKLDYTPEARDCGKAGKVKPALYGEGIIPGYGGHKQGAKFGYGSTIYTNSKPQGGAAHDNYGGRNLASTGIGASSLASGDYKVKDERIWDANLNDHGMGGKTQIWRREEQGFQDNERVISFAEMQAMEGPGANRNH